MAVMLDAWSIAAALAACLLAVVLGMKLRSRLALSRAKHRSLAGHSRLSRRIAALVPRYAYDDAQFFRADDADTDIVERRRAGFEELSRKLRLEAARTLGRAAEAAPHISDLQFTESYRVPFQFNPRVKAALPASSFVESSNGVQVRGRGMNHHCHPERSTRRAAQSRDLFLSTHRQKRSLRFASLRS